MFIEASRDLQMLFEAVMHLLDGLNLQTLLALRVERYLICLVDTRRLKVSIIEQQSVFSVEVLSPGIKPFKM
jgi:hypothetical protein